MTMTPEQYEKRIAEATVPVVPKRASERAWPTQPQLARTLEDNLAALRVTAKEAA